MRSRPRDPVHGEGEAECDQKPAEGSPPQRRSLDAVSQPGAGRRSREQPECELACERCAPVARPMRRSSVRRRGARAPSTRLRGRDCRSRLRFARDRGFHAAGMRDLRGRVDDRRFAVSRHRISARSRRYGERERIASSRGTPPACLSRARAKGVSPRLAMFARCGSALRSLCLDSTNCSTRWPARWTRRAWPRYLRNPPRRAWPPRLW